LQPAVPMAYAKMILLLVMDAKVFLVLLLMLVTLLNVMLLLDLFLELECVLSLQFLAMTEMHAQLILATVPLDVFTQTLFVLVMLVTLLHATLQMVNVPTPQLTVMMETSALMTLVQFKVEISAVFMYLMFAMITITVLLTLVLVLLESIAVFLLLLIVMMEATVPLIRVINFLVVFTQTFALEMLVKIPLALPINVSISHEDVPSMILLEFNASQLHAMQQKEDVKNQLLIPTETMLHVTSYCYHQLRREELLEPVLLQLLLLPL
jgi:hypothetical protein